MRTTRPIRGALHNRWCAAALVSAASTAGFAGDATAQRGVEMGPERHRLTSTDMPSASIDVDASLEYVGGAQFVLRGAADVELHVFVEANGTRVERLLWVQFEGYRDGNDFTYDYSNDPAVEVDGRTFHVNGRFYPPAGFRGRPGSDGDHALELLTAAGFELGSDLARVRLVWLLNDPPRDELMFIYVEDLGSHGLTVDQLEADENRWAELQAALRERAFASFEITPSPSDGRGESGR